MSSLPLSSSSSSSSSSYVSPKKYDVFLSFRGEDTRKKFTDHLYDALKRSGIITFRDDPRLEAGEAIAPELFKAIQESWCSIIVFSETYAFSGWCLDELAEIVKQKNEMGHKVFPIFYDVDPSDLRKQTGRVAEAFAKHEERYKENTEKTQSWRSALTEVANLKGWHLNDRQESEFIGDIVKKILAKLCQINSSVPDDLIGINSRLEQLHSKINIGGDDIRIIGICGMGGIGKTTLARVVYSQMSPYFEGRCFLSDVREVSDKFGLASLQKQLLSQIFPEECFNFFDVHEGSLMISRRLSHKKVVIVIDDVDNIQHLKWLVGRRNWFGSGSRIIVTTRDEHVLLLHRVDDVCEPRELDDNEALHLFSLKAFNTDAPENGFIELSKSVVKYADGLPLALEVLGSFLCGRNAAQWESAIARLKRDSNKEIHDRLLISFDGLEETEKKIFLDIACFFKGENKGFVTKILDGCGFFPDIGIDVLVKKSLIKVYHGNCLGMHDLLQEMGRKIVKQNSPDEPGQRCRLWEEKDVYHVLTNNTATETIEGMDIDIKCSEEIKMFTSNADAFLKMKKLRLLRVFNFPNSHDVKYLSNELRLLHWTGYPSKTLPSSFQLHNLVALLLPYSRIEQLWKGNIRLEKLKLLDLKGSENLIKTPDFTMAHNLESLILEDCIKIIDVDPSIGVLRRLKHLNLRNCKSLRSLPSSISGLKCLKTLDLSGCSLPQSLQQVESLEEPDLCETSITLPPLSGLASLTELDMRYCNIGEGAIPSDIFCLSSLKSLLLDGNKFISLPANLDRLSNLEYLGLENCMELKSLPELLSRTNILNREYHPFFGVFANATVRSSIEWARLLFPNCHRLSENTNVLTLLKKRLKATANSTKLLDILLPGSEIPEWFPHQRDGYSIKISLPPHILNDGQWIGVAFCCVVVNVSVVSCEVRRRNSSLRIRPIDIHFTPVTKHHLWLRYWSRNIIYPFSSEDNSSGEYGHLSSQEYQPFELEVKVGVRCGERIISEPYKEVKKCGIRVVCERDLEEMENIEGHFLQICNPSCATLEDIPSNADDESKTGKGTLVKRKRNIFEDEAGASVNESGSIR